MSGAHDSSLCRPFGGFSAALAGAALAVAALAAVILAPVSASAADPDGRFLLAQASTGTGGGAGNARAGTSGQTTLTIDPKTVPKAALIGAMMKSDEGLTAVQSYLAEGNGKPEQIAARARALLIALRDQYQGADPAALQEAVARVAQIAATGLSTAKVMKINVERNFRPGGVVRAFNFGPPDMTVLPGFEPVTTNDPRIKGQAVTGLRHPGDGGMLDTGVAGIEQFSIQVPNGRYRLVLLTDDTGDPALRTAPFGTGVRVNGIPIPIQQTMPNDWLQSAELGNNAASVLAQGQAGGQGDSGGGIVIETVVTDGRLVVNIPPTASKQFKSYLSAAVLEPVDGPSIFAPSAEAQTGIFDLHDVTKLQSEVASAVADVLSKVAPAAGPPPDKLPDPVFQSLVAASPS